MKKNRGFTLIELLIVIAIFALIANVTMVSLNKAKRESRDAKRVANINQLRSALHLYSTDNLSYPDDNNGSAIAIGTDGHLVLDDTGWSNGTSPTSPIFMYSVPRDPSMTAAQSSSLCTGSSTEICDYSYTLNNNNYIIYFYLEGSVGSMDEGIHAATKDKIL
jgi:prepilin-type N-terminal cleavage/methylation domain-containing protein